MKDATQPQESEGGVLKETSTKTHKDEHSNAGAVGGRGVHKICAISKRLALHIEGQVLSKYLQVRYAKLLHAVRPLGLYFERQVFPALREENEPWLELHVDEASGLRGVAGEYHASYLDTEIIAERLRAYGIRGVRLDTKLEYGQVVEALLLLLHVAGSLQGAEPCDDGTCPSYSGWRRSIIAGRMLHSEGLRRVCAIMRIDPEERMFSVEYSYCELFLSRAVTHYVQKQDRFRDHRVLLHAAPWTAVVVFALMASVWLSAQWLPAIGGLAWFVMAALIALLFGGYTQAIGAFLYTQEHYEQLVKNYVVDLKRADAELSGVEREYSGQESRTGKSVRVY